MKKDKFTTEFRAKLERLINEMNNTSALISTTLVERDYIQNALRGIVCYMDAKIK